MGKPCAHNQTQREHIIDDEDKKSESLAPESGVAIFVVPDLEKGVDALKGVAVDGIDYEEAVRRAEHCMMFKWVPHSVGTIEDYPAAKAELDARCLGGRCWSSDECGSWCFCGGLGPVYECELY